jgi:uncharacterized membrane protein YbhN (UPF0104 family)
VSLTEPSAPSAAPAEAAERNPALRRWLGYLARLGLGVAIVFWLAGQGGWERIAGSLSRLHPGWFAGSLALLIGGQSLCAFKWRLLARGLGFPRSYAFCWVHYFGAMFPSLFLPTSLGGDVLRGLALCRGGGDKLKAAVSVLADRGTGFLAMVWIAAAASLLGVDEGRLPTAVSATVYGLAAVLTGGFFLLFPLAPLVGRRWGPETLIGRALTLWRDPPVLLTSLALGAVFQVGCCLTFYLLGRALDLPVPPAYYALLTPLAAVASLSPVTINALGERTAVLIVLLSYVGVAREPAIAFSLAWTGLMALTACLGGVVLLVAGAQVSAPAPVAGG